MIACPVGELLKGEVLSSSNARRIKNLHGRVSEDSHVRGWSRCPAGPAWSPRDGCGPRDMDKLLQLS
ncbi:hypothetical protein F2Q68_00043009 [Brassica cretica]|uniref:Uncharacterized protein n=1 Tax=Brassica cretica TaxID=69181 RepID=A0A8S9LNF7_BRACR|nr:hypothetical protein F2Q68_00043009 [Brassica cretica]